VFEFSVVFESPTDNRFHIRPDDIKLINDSVAGVFGKAEIEQSAGKLVSFFQSRGYWCPFTLDELQRYYKEKGWNTNAVFFGLVGAWYDDTFLPTWNESWPCLGISPDGLHYVTDHFILRCANKLG